MPDHQGKSDGGWSVDYMIGARSGRLVVISLEESRRAKSGRLQTYCTCKCDCGRTISILRESIKTNNSKSCGCLNGAEKDLTGKRYGRLTLLEKLPSTGGKYRLYRALCECGNITVVPGPRAKAGKFSSCGCLRVDQARLNGRSKHRRFEDTTVAEHLTISQYKEGARSRDLTFELTAAQCVWLFSLNCAYCGQPPSNVCKPTRNRPIYYYSGIDRVDNTIGYIESNVVPCCKQCNISKRDLPVGKFLEWVSRLSKYQLTGRLPVKTNAVVNGELIT